MWVEPAEKVVLGVNHIIGKLKIVSELIEILGNWVEKETWNIIIWAGGIYYERP